MNTILNNIKKDKGDYNYTRSSLTCIRYILFAGPLTTWSSWTADYWCWAATTAIRACTRPSVTTRVSTGGLCRRRCLPVGAPWAPHCFIVSTWTPSFSSCRQPPQRRRCCTRAASASLRHHRGAPRPSPIRRSSPPPRPYDCRGRPPAAGGRTIPNVLTRCPTKRFIISTTQLSRRPTIPHNRTRHYKNTPDHFNRQINHSVYVNIIRFNIDDYPSIFYRLTESQGYTVIQYYHCSIFINTPGDKLNK